jgi:hypothetical protein
LAAKVIVAYDPYPTPHSEQAVMSSSSGRPPTPPSTHATETNLTGIHQNQLKARTAELSAMKGTGLVARASQKMAMSTLAFEPRTAHLAEPSGSPHMEQIKKNLGEVGLSSMFARNSFVQKLASRDYNFTGADRSMEKMLSAMADSPGRRGKLKVQQGVSQNYFSPSEKKIELVDPRNLPYAAHEMRHAYDHLKGKLDLNQPLQRLAGEHNAFTTQTIVAGQLGVPSGIERTPYEQAKTYHGKPGYPGTVDESIAEVARWKKITP